MNEDELWLDFNWVKLQKDFCLEKRQQKYVENIVFTVFVYATGIKQVNECIDGRNDGHHTWHQLCDGFS